MRNSALAENKIRGTQGFPIAYYRLDEKHPQYIMELHWHNEFEIIRVLEGEFRCFLNHTAYDLKAGDVLTVGGGVLHRGEPMGAVYECAVFDINMLRRRSHATSRFFDPLISHNAEILPGICDEKIKNAAGRLFSALSGGSEFFELEVYSALYDYFAGLYKNGSVNTPSGTDNYSRHRNETVLHLLDWCEEHFTEQITLKRLSEVSGMSEKYLCRFFKEFTGCTPIEYINRARIEHASVLLAFHRATVTDAAMESGFNDLSYFSRIFKRYKGVRPSEIAGRKK